MRARLVATLLATVMTLAFMPGVASADMPLDVDCDVLETTLIAVDAFLDGQGVEFDNYGQLVSSAIGDDAVFEQLNALITFFSGGQISFASASQAVSTVAKCGLTDDLVGLVSS